MAKPQLEDGFTPIANEILERLVQFHLSPNQWQVLLFIIRKTYGFHKKVDYIANSQIGEATGLCKAVISRCLKELNDRQLIIRKGKYIGFQKDWEKWGKLAVQSTLTRKKIPETRKPKTNPYAITLLKDIEPKFQSMAGNKGYVYEHRLVIARKLGRCLEPWEIVHHIDGIRSHNSEDNLEMYPSQAEHIPTTILQKRIKELEDELAVLQTPLKLAIPSSTVAESSTKVSSPRVTQKIKDTLTKEKDITPSKKKNYFFNNILLTPEEYDKLVKIFGEAGIKDRLEGLSLYKQSKGKKYSSDYATVLAWERRDKRMEGGRDGAHRGKTRQLKSREAYTESEDYPA